jgi:hypothetical protein
MLGIRVPRVAIGIKPNPKNVRISVKIDSIRTKQKAAITPYPVRLIFCFSNRQLKNDYCCQEAAKFMELAIIKSNPAVFLKIGDCVMGIPS